MQLVVNIGVFRAPEGKEIRRVKEIDYVTGGVEGDMITHEPIFKWTVERGKEDWTGQLQFTNAYPSNLIRRLEERVPGFKWERDVESVKP